MEITEYSISASIETATTIALVSDLHDRPFESIKQAFSCRKPDIIAITGDLVDGHIVDSVNGLAFLRYAAGVAPTFYSLGNHEWKFDAEDVLTVARTGVMLLDNSAVQLGDINIGGLSSGFYVNKIKSSTKVQPKPELAWLNEFGKTNGYKLLLCHHPEYYEKYILSLPIDLVLSGHAHGGQIRLFGRGLFAPGQGFLPQYTSGVHDNRLVISRGLANTARLVPRLWNPTEIVYITLMPN